MRFEGEEVDKNIKIMLEMCSGTHNYPWATICGIGIAYFGHFGKKSKKWGRGRVLGGKKTIPTWLTKKALKCGPLRQIWSHFSRICGPRHNKIILPVTVWKHQKSINYCIVDPGKRYYVQKKVQRSILKTMTFKGVKTFIFMIIRISEPNMFT